MSNYQPSEHTKKQILAAFGMNAGAHLLSNSGSRSRTPSRTRTSRSGSRSRSQSRPKNMTRRGRRSMSQPKRVGVGFAKSGKPLNMKNTFPHILKQLSPILSSIATTKKKVLLAKANYFNKDNKDVKSTDVTMLEQQLEMLQKEFDMLRATFRAGLKDRPIRMRLSATLELTATVTSGVVNTVAVGGGSSALNPNVCTEWATMVALFDEYKCLGGEAAFNYVNASSTAGTGIATNSLPVMAYDVDNAASAGSSISLTQCSQHKILNSNVVSTVSAYPCLQKFRWHVPKGVEIGSAGTTMAGTEWIASANPQSAGCLLFYHVGTTVTAINVGAGVCYFDLEYRCRV